MEYELLTSMYFPGVGLRDRGDVVDIDDEKVEHFLSIGAIAKKGHLAALAKEREQAEQAAAERAVEAVRLSDEEAHRVTAHAQDRLAAPTPAVVPSRASSDGPRTTRRAR